MKLKKIIIFVISVFMVAFLYAEQNTIDDTLRFAASDIVNKCNRNSIIVIDDFFSPSQKMTKYIREQLNDHILSQDSLIDIVTREFLYLVEKESRFQNSGKVDEKTIRSVAGKLGANSVIFGSVEEFATGYDLEIRMLDVKTAKYLFSKTYHFSRSSKTEQLLGRAAIYYNSAIGFFAEINKNSLEFIAPALGVQFDYAFFKKISTGLKVTASYDFKEKDNTVFTAEPIVAMRFYVISPTGEPVSGLFLEPQIGASLVFVNSELRGSFNIGSGIGFRMSLDNFYVEPFLRGGYPYLFGAGIAAGLRF